MSGFSGPPSRAVYLVSAPDQPGLVARLAGFFYRLGLNIVDASNHTDAHTPAGPKFFMRLVVDLAGLGQPRAAAELAGSATRGAVDRAFAELVAELGGEFRVAYSDHVARVAILCTKDPACLYDLVLRQRAGELPCEIPLVISNHAHLEPVAASFRIPFFALPVTPETKPQQERDALALLHTHHIDLVVLARYMQVLSEDFLSGAPPVINIHHGFLPAFQGGKPYHQAYARGVKLIGATAHYATSDLDEGPIIEQDVSRVNHAMQPDDLVRLGRDIERVVLARAVRAHLENRVFIEGKRTIVF